MAMRQQVSVSLSECDRCGAARAVRRPGRGRSAPDQGHSGLPMPSRNTYHDGRNDLARALLPSQGIPIAGGQQPQRYLGAARVLQAVLGFLNGTLRAATRSISSSGFTTVLEHSPRVGEEVSVLVRMPGGEPFQVRAGWSGRSCRRATLWSRSNGWVCPRRTESAFRSSSSTPRWSNSSLSYRLFLRKDAEAPKHSHLRGPKPEQPNRRTQSEQRISQEREPFVVAGVGPAEIEADPAHPFVAEELHKLLKGCSFQGTVNVQEQLSVLFAPGHPEHLDLPARCERPAATLGKLQMPYRRIGASTGTLAIYNPSSNPTPGAMDHPVWRVLEPGRHSPTT